MKFRLLYHNFLQDNKCRLCVNKSSCRNFTWPAQIDQLFLVPWGQINTWRSDFVCRNQMKLLGISRNPTLQKNHSQFHIMDFRWGSLNLRKSNTHISCTLRSWVIEIFSHSRTVSPRLGDNYASKCWSDNFHTQNIYHHAWKTVRTTLQCIVGLQSRG